MKFSALSIIIVAVLFIVLFILNKRMNQKKKSLEVAVDAVTFASGVILFLYLAGLALNITYLTQIDEFSLFIALFISGISLISSVTDKYRSKRGKKDGEKK